MNRDKFNIHNELSITRAEGNRMTVMLNRPILSILLGGCIAGAALVGAALSQPPGGGPPGSGGGGGPGGGGPGGGPGGGGKTSPTVNYQVCNKTNDVPIIFVTTVSIVGGKQFRAQGWTQVPKGQCVSTGMHERPAVWWHARAQNGMFWGEGQVDICINLNSAFNYTWDGGNRQCAPGETVQGLMKLDFRPDETTVTMNLTAN
jgi:uncharacterized membrane protein